MRFLSLLSLPLLLSSLGVSASPATHHHHPTIYIIRHGEKSNDSSDFFLNPAGYQRAECLRSVFGAKSKYDIRYILAPTVLPTGEHARSYETVAPLGEDLDVVIDTSCSRNDIKCLKRKVHHYRGPGNILISWRHGKMKKILKKLGMANPIEYPEDRFDIIWTDPYPYTNVTDIRSENCPGLDVPERALFVQP